MGSYYMIHGCGVLISQLDSIHISTYESSTIIKS